VADKDRAQRVGELAKARGLQVGVAESLTCGHLAATLGTAPETSSWFRGGIVAYATAVKQDLLGLEDDRVVTDACARQMARAAAGLLGADAVVSATGVGGPGSEEGEPAGTVYVATSVSGHVESHRLQLEGGPPEVLDQAVSACLQLLESAIAFGASLAGGGDGRP
jgi:nicotinamide-nucleotide amidase